MGYYQNLLITYFQGTQQNNKTNFAYIPVKFLFYYHPNLCNSTMLHQTTAKQQQNFNTIRRKLCHHSSSSRFMFFYVWCFHVFHAILPLLFVHIHAGLMKWARQFVYGYICWQSSAEVMAGNLCADARRCWIKKYPQRRHSHSFWPPLWQSLTRFQMAPN